MRDTRVGKGKVRRYEGAPPFCGRLASSHVGGQSLQITARPEWVRHVFAEGASPHKPAVRMPIISRESTGAWT
jgi:hypothetical protein